MNRAAYCRQSSCVTPSPSDTVFRQADPSLILPPSPSDVFLPVPGLALVLESGQKYVVSFDATLANVNPSLEVTTWRIENPLGQYVVGTRRTVYLGPLGAPAEAQTVAMHADVVGTGLPVVITYFAGPADVLLDSFSFSATKTT